MGERSDQTPSPFRRQSAYSRDRPLRLRSVHIEQLHAGALVRVGPGAEVTDYGVSASAWISAAASAEASASALGGPRRPKTRPSGPSSRSGGAGSGARLAASGNRAWH